VLADIDLDGDLDLVSASTGDSTIRLLLNDGDAVFSEVAQYTAGASPNAVAAADINDDGLPDLVSANQGSNTITIVLSGA
jgi:hypothetical protein